MAGLSLAGMAHLASAHTPYLLPTTFEITRDHVSAQAALSEDVYFIPDFAMRNSDYFVIGPDGGSRKLESVTPLKDFVVIEAPIAGDGTYRLTTGEAAGRSRKAAYVDGEWRPVRPARRGPATPPGDGDAHEGEHRPGTQRAAQGSGAQQPARTERPRGRGIDEKDIPAGADVVETRTSTRVETYVTKGAPSNGALKASGHGLELEPVTHPNEIYGDQGFSFVLLVDGKPVEDVGVTVFRGGNAYEDKKVFAEAKTGTEGRVDLSFDKPGVYLLKTSYPPRQQPTDKPPAQAFSYTLTFEVLP